MGRAVPIRDRCPKWTEADSAGDGSKGPLGRLGSVGDEEGERSMATGRRWKAELDDDMGVGSEGTWHA